MNTPTTPDHFTDAAVRRTTYLDAAREADDAAKLFPDNLECAPAIGALQGLADRLRRLAGHYTTAEQPSGLTWEARADHAVRLYATTAIERDDARTEAARLRERVAELEQRDAMLTAMEAAGVDNWSGMGYAIELRDAQAQAEQPAS
ncbi:hypothetical protein MHW47_10795 [Streptomyces sp. OfavH-34-F]|uniref:hypothetical protein n=1 Tax=Streptomyces sp. OfavH-34-F TaxID=2917760 RepID=UPI001EF3B6ED|nr:hypothetical protein [Streptomyces sp. OfavH-34-F]MCG7524921.1 hypothetical protein [Streptomyces sp. OfavH-34-F]